MHLRLALVSICCLAGISGNALAQDASADPPLAIHGFNDLTVKNDYITPRGLLVSSNRFTTQILNGLVGDVFHDPGSPIDDVSLVAGIWNDIDSGQNSLTVGPWNEFDWFVGTNFEIQKIWTFGVSYVAFLSPPGNFSAEHNVEFSLKLDDSALLAPISLHPYVKLFYEFAGPSVVVTGKGAGTFDVELGAVPTLDLHPYSVPATLTAPTWVTVGPSDFWGGGGNVGVFSTGFTTTFPLDGVPKRYGSWNFHFGLQYYHEVNNKLLVAQTLLGTAGTGSGHRDIAVGFAGIGLNF